jgi:TatD-related deoxyribonuclease
LNVIRRSGLATGTDRSLGAKPPRPSSLRRARKRDTFFADGGRCGGRVAGRLPVFDDHFHLDPRGRGVEAVKEFARAGGTGLMLVHKPYHEAEGHLNRTLADHQRQMEATLRLADQARAAAPEVAVLVAVAPHPAEFTGLVAAGVPLDEAAAVQRAALEHAQRLVREGKAVAMSEVGRPHWRPVADDLMGVANQLMEYSFQLARDAGCAVQIHAETADAASFADLARHLKRAGLPAERAVKHYSTPLVDTAVNGGLWPSVLIGKGSAEAAIAGGTRFLMETDYMDDPRYPGAVLGPKTVPRRTRELLDKGLMTEEQAWIVHHDNPRRVYGVELG